VTRLRPVTVAALFTARAAMPPDRRIRCPRASYHANCTARHIARPGARLCPMAKPDRAVCPGGPYLN